MGAFQEIVRQLEQALLQKDTLESVRSLKSVVVSFKQLKQEVERTPHRMARSLYEKIGEGIVDLSKDITDSNDEFALNYVQRVLLPDARLLEKLLYEKVESESVLVGFYNPEWNPLRSASEDRLRALQEAVDGLEMEAIYFESTDVDLESKMIQAKHVVQGKVEEVKSRFPNVIYNKNTGSYRNQDRVQRTLRKTIPFMQHTMTDKLHLPLELQGQSELNGLFVPSVYVNSLDSFFSFFEEHEVGVLKNTKEERGEGVHFIQKDGDSFVFHRGKEQLRWSKVEMEDYIRHQVLPNSYLIQKYIDTRNTEGRSVDFRMYVAKNEVGQWQIVKDYARLGASDNILTHVYYGGSREDTEKYLQRTYGEDAEAAHEALLATSYQVAKDVDRLYGYALDELGIDLAIDGHGQIWMYEVNTGPWTGFFEKERASHMMGYVRYLAWSGAVPHNRFQNSVGYRSDESELECVNGEGRQVIGLLTGNMDFYAVSGATIANAQGQELFVFRPEDVDAELQRIRGSFLKGHEWVRKDVPYPSFIIDRLVKCDDKSYTYLYSEFEQTPMTYDFKPHVIERDSLYNLLFADEGTRSFLLPYRVSQRMKDVQELIGVTGSVVLRPLKEEQGQIVLTREGKTYVWKEEGRNVVELSRDEVRERLRQRLKEEKMLIQSIPAFETEDGMYLKVRGHFLKREDEWVLKQVNPLLTTTMSNLYLEERDFLYGDLADVGNKNWERPQEILEGVQQSMKKVVDVLSERLTMSPHYIAVDCGVDGVTGDCYVLDVSLKEPTSPYVAFPVMEELVRYAKDQLK